MKTFGGHELAFLEMGRVLSIRFKFGAEVIIRRHPHPDGEDGHFFEGYACSLCPFLFHMFNLSFRNKTMDLNEEEKLMLTGSSNV